MHAPPLTSSTITCLYTSNKPQHFFLCREITLAFVIVLCYLMRYNVVLANDAFNVSIFNISENGFLRKPWVLCTDEPTT